MFKPILYFTLLKITMTVFFFFIFYFYLFIIVTEREAETQAEGEAGSMHWEPDVWDSILGLQDRALGQRQAPNHCATQGSPIAELEIKGIPGQEGPDGMEKVVEQREIRGGTGWGRWWGDLSITARNHEVVAARLSLIHI